MNIIRSGGQLKVACVEAPSYGDARLDRLRDMALYLGANVGDDPMGIKFEAMSEADFGSCDKIIIKRDETVISGGHGNEEDIKARVEAIQGEISNLKENATWEKDVLNKRLAALTTGVAVIKVGGSSEEEIKELKDRLEDAQYAVKAALEEGYLPGGGVTLLRLASEVDELRSDNEDELVGMTIFASALKAPFKTIVENAGLHADVVIPQVLAQAPEYGYNVATMKVANMLEDGIIDPTKAVKGAVFAASSIASVALTSSVIICEDPKENNGVNLNMQGMPMM
jgi:chaperonin GroEL